MRESRVEGFTLIELLTVVLVLGVLAAIAVPTLNRHQDRARVAAIQSDLRNAAAAQASLTVAQGTPGDALGDLVDVGFRVSPDVVFTNDGQFTQHPSGMCMEVEHARMPGRSWAFSAERAANPFEGTC